MIGIICSGGGSAISAAYPWIAEKGIKLFVATDRSCGIEKFCTESQISFVRLSEKDNAAFSTKAAAVFRDEGVQCVLLYFDRLIGTALTAQWLCVNFHPSLLPAYKGFRAIERAIADKIRYLGHTCHIADESTDGGPILAQSTYPLLAEDYDVARAYDISFVQKLALTLLTIDLLDGKQDREHQVDAFRNRSPSHNSAFINPNLLPVSAKELIVREASKRQMSIAL